MSVCVHAWKHTLIAKTSTIINCFAFSLAVQNLPTNAGDTRDVGLAPGVGNGTPLQYSCLENSMGRGPWQATVHGAIELDTTEQESTYHHTNRAQVYYNGLYLNELQAETF